MVREALRFTPRLAPVGQKPWSQIPMAHEKWGGESEVHNKPCQMLLLSPNTIAAPTHLNPDASGGYQWRQPVQSLSRGQGESQTGMGLIQKTWSCSATTISTTLPRNSKFDNG